MRKYQVKLDDGKIVDMSYIGINHTIDGNFYGDIISSYNKHFDSEDLIIITDPKAPVRCATIGDIKGAYELLRNEVASRSPRDAESYLFCVQRAIELYFGPYAKDKKKRLSYYPTEEDILNNGKERGQIAKLGGKNPPLNLAVSPERAAVAQNLLMSCSIDVYSTFKISATTINGKDRVHAYNLVHETLDDKYYICDFAIPTLRNGEISPIVCEIPKEVYEQMINPLPNIGYSVEVDYNNPVNKKNYIITYDAGRDEVYKVNQVLVKKKGQYERF